MPRPFDPKDGAFAADIRRAGDDDLSELREAMRGGWLEEFPALIDENGVVLVGHRRLKVAAELGLKPVVKTLKLGAGDAADAKRVRLAFVSNVGGRPMTATDRQRVGAHLYGLGWTMQRIGEALGATKMTISRDLEGCNTVLQPPRPKGGRPKGARPTPNTIAPETEEALKQALDAGKSREQIAAELGLSMTPVRRVAREQIAVAAERARVAAEGPQFTRADLSLPYQAKFDAAVARYRKELAAQFDQEVSAELAKYAAATWLPSHQERLDRADRIIAAKKGVMTRQTYRKILSCLHPDSRLAVSETVLNALFVEFGKLEKVLCKSEEDVALEKGMGLHHPTAAEWEQIKQKIVAERKAAREKRAAERAAAVSG